MTKFYTIFDAIKHSEFEEAKKKDLLDMVRSHLNSFIEYFNSVVSIEIFVQSRSSWDSVSEYMYKNMDENRRNCHDKCVFACAELNDICDYLKLDKICDFDIKNRGEVAKFCGHIISGIYTKGISEEKSFDMLVERFKADNEKIDLINENEQEELSI